MNLPRITVAVDSRLECISIASSLVRSFCRAVGVSETKAFQIEVCLSEAMSNAVLHAYKGRAGKPIEVAAWCEGGELLFEVRDQGFPMDAAVLSRDRRGLLEIDPASLTNLDEGGRGLAIIQSIMKELRYSSAGGMNCLSMKL